MAKTNLNREFSAFNPNAIRSTDDARYKSLIGEEDEQTQDFEITQNQFANDSLNNTNNNIQNTQTQTKTQKYNNIDDLDLNNNENATTSIFSNKKEFPRIVKYGIENMFPKVEFDDEEVQQPTIKKEGNMGIDNTIFDQIDEDDKFLFQEPNKEIPVKQTITLQDYKQYLGDKANDEKQIHKNYLDLRNKGVEVAGYDEFLNTVRERAFEKNQQTKKIEQEIAIKNMNLKENKIFGAMNKIQAMMAGTQNQIVDNRNPYQKGLDGVNEWINDPNKDEWVHKTFSHNLPRWHPQHIVDMSAKATYGLAKATTSAGLTIMSHPIDSALAITTLPLAVGEIAAEKVYDTSNAVINNTVLKSIENVSGIKLTPFVEASQKDLKEKISNMYNTLLEKGGDTKNGNVVGGLIGSYFKRSRQMAKGLNTYYSEKYGTEEKFAEQIYNNPGDVIVDFAPFVGGIAKAGSKIVQTEQYAKFANEIQALNKSIPTTKDLSNHIINNMSQNVVDILKSTKNTIKGNKTNMPESLEGVLAKLGTRDKIAFHLENIADNFTLVDAFMPSVMRNLMVDKLGRPALKVGSTIASTSNVLGRSMDIISNFHKSVLAVMTQHPQLVKSYLKGEVSEEAFKDVIRQQKGINTQNVQDLLDNVKINAKKQFTQNNIIGKIEDYLKERKEEITYDVDKLDGYNNYIFDITPVTNKLSQMQNSAGQSVSTEITKISKYINEIMDEYSNKGLLNGTAITKISNTISDKLGDNSGMITNQSKGLYKELYKHLEDVKDTLPGRKEMNLKYKSQKEHINEITKLINDRNGLKDNIGAIMTKLINNKQKYNINENMLKLLDDDIQQLKNINNIEANITKGELGQILDNIKQNEFNNYFKEAIDDKGNVIKDPYGKLKKVAKTNKQQTFLNKLVNDKDFGAEMLSEILLEPKYSDELEKTAKILKMKTNDFKTHLSAIHARNFLDNLINKHTIFNSQMRGVITLVGMGGFAGGIMMGNRFLAVAGLAGIILSQPKVARDIVLLGNTISNPVRHIVGGVLNDILDGKVLTPERLKQFYNASQDKDLIEAMNPLMKQTQANKIR